MKKILGVTGGIATGKSTVVDIFRAHGFPIIDGDLIAREVVVPNSPGLAAIVGAFGKEILTEEGTLDRKKLGRIVFQEEAKLNLLNQVLNPFIRSEILRQLQEAEAPLVIADIPLLFEGYYDQYVDQVAVVYLPESLQVQRLMERDNFSQESAMQRIRSQMPIDEKRNRADIVFDNQGTRQQTKKIVEDWLRQNQFI
ncbi:MULTISPECIES: dephospho-CoA kinase [Enterococcus]|uniref:dephospho-CoA kinase n=1 Tax=Enterococcus TaxID=1350 RepID=UPI0010F5BAA4|nr:MULTISPECIES: dephospho-CoA kinase [Enterococcus]KAF1304699.1 dephospho-CoA kinase [Enterococcus sp. JM9B]